MKRNYLEKFQSLLDENASFELADYGDILYKGWDEPDDNLKEEFSKKYDLYS